MHKLTQQFSYRIIWAYNILRKKGFKPLFGVFLEFLYLKRECYIMIYNLGKSLERPLCDKKIQIINNDFNILNHVRKENPDLPIEFYYDQIDGCDQFYLLLIEQNNKTEPASIGWVYDDNKNNRFIKLCKDEIEFKHVFVLEKFRRKKLFTIQTYYMLNDLKSKGFKSVVNLVEAHNSASLNAHQNLGFEIASKWTFRKFLGIRFSKFSTAQLDAGNPNELDFL